MFNKNKEAFIACFQEIDDPRADEKLVYPLDEIIFLVISSVLSSAESWGEIIKYGKNKLSLLKKYFGYEHGIPSKSTICTVMGSIDKRKFEKWLIKWAESFSDSFPEELIAIDGKTLRGSRRKDQKGIHVLNAFATKRGIVLAQRVVNEKTNEIPEIPKLLDDLNLKDCVVSTDAMGCQKKIAAKIIEKDADYFLALKGNQGELFKQVKSFFTEKNKEKSSFSETLEKGHGRIEVRKCWSMPIPPLLKTDTSDWKKLCSVSLVLSERHIGDNISTEERVYISSLTADAKKHLEYARKHWQVENNVHWVLDVTFNEDASLIKNAAENMSIVRKLIINLVKKYKDKTQDKTGIKILRKAAGWSDELAEGILNGLFN